MSDPDGTTNNYLLLLAAVARQARKDATRADSRYTQAEARAWMEWARREIGALGEMTPLGRPAGHYE